MPRPRPSRIRSSTRYELDLAAIAEFWRRGSVVSSWLLDLTSAALHDSPGARGLHRPRLGLGRGSLDLDRGDRHRHADAGSHDRALLALHVEWRGRLRQPAALRAARRVRRARREALVTLPFEVHPDPSAATRRVAGLIAARMHAGDSTLALSRGAALLAGLADEDVPWARRRASTRSTSASRLSGHDDRNLTQLDAFLPAGSGPPDAGRRARPRGCGRRYASELPGGLRPRSSRPRAGWAHGVARPRRSRARRAPTVSSPSRTSTTDIAG